MTDLEVENAILATLAARTYSAHELREIYPPYATNRALHKLRMEGKISCEDGQWVLTRVG